MKHLGTKTLEIERLILRKFETNDDKAMYDNWGSHEEVTKFLTWHHKSIEDSRKILKEWNDLYENEDFYQWAIIPKNSKNEPIGSISVVSCKENIAMVHIGYCIGERWWNKGITSEAFSAVIKFLMEEVGVNRIETKHDTRNINSGKVMEKCGLKYEGTLRKSDICNSGIGDYSFYGMLAKEYKEYLK